MNILIDGAENARTYTNVDRETTSYRTQRDSEKIESGGFALDISGTVMDNSAYAGHGRTAEEVMAEAGQQDITARRNYMAVMSNSMSDEDFAKMQEEGFHPGSTDIETVVTIVDEIKAALAKGGVQVEGYTDTISDDALKDITGSEAFAKELKRQFAEKDVPLTKENVEAVTEAFQILNQAGIPSDGSIKYMVENNLEPTPENLYTAKYSAASGSTRQGKGYYAAGAVAGYYVRKPEEIDFSKLRPQMEKVITMAGYEVNEQTLKDAEWLVEKGIPLNTDTFSKLSGIKTHQFPVSYKDFMDSAACAAADGIDPAKADLGRKETYARQAAVLYEKTVTVDIWVVDVITAKNLPLTLRNIFALQNEIPGRDIPVNIRGRRLLEEIRLSMTVEANIKLLRSGFQIETAPLEELVGKLKKAEESYATAITGQVDTEQAKEKASLYRETLDVLRGIKSSPADIVVRVSRTDTLREVRDYGASQKLVYDKAGQSYETMMTEPRKDMGDSIQKAFRNVDDILESMQMEQSDANRRAVRILGYNSVEITVENIEQVKEKDDLLGSVIEEMKPGRVLNMIREGVNPLAMSLEELHTYLSSQTDPAGEMESYSRFLYKLEKKKDISEEERSAYIGIYRLVHQIEKADDAAVGALWQMGAEFTLGNLLSALRSARRGKMDYSVDDGFGGVNKKETGRESISNQIEKGYQPDTDSGRKVLEQILDEAGDEQAGREFDHMVYEQIRTAAKSEEEVFRYLSDYEQPVTADNLMAAGYLLKSPKDIWGQLKKLSWQDEEKESGAEQKGDSDLVEQAGKEVLEALDGKENAGDAYGRLQHTLQKMIEKMAYSDTRTSMDIRAMSVLYKQISFMGNMAREENYEIPADIDGSLTSINLKIIHNGQKESKVAITFESEIFGKTAAEFKITAQGLTGFCICNSEKGAGLLKENQGLLKEKFKKEQIAGKEIYFAVGESLDLAEFSLKETDHRQAGDDSKTLYRAAKAFIGYVQETGRQKGNINYENQL